MSVDRSPESDATDRWRAAGHTIELHYIPLDRS